MTARITDNIAAFNTERIARYYARKEQALVAGTLPFLRGTPPLFFDLLARTWQGALGPHTWVCGDLHLENIGVVALAGHDEEGRHPVGLVINDYDEAAVGPCGWDVLRGAVSLRLACGRDAALQEQALAFFWRAYGDTLGLFARRGRIMALYGEESELYCGACATAPDLPKPLRENVRRVARRKHKKFLDSRTVRTKSGRRFIVGERYQPVDDGGAMCRAIEDGLRRYADRGERHALRVQDVAFRVAGTNSLGLERYAVLAVGDGTPDGSLLIDIKEARPSCLTPYLHPPQPSWTSEGQRVATAQRIMQGLEPPLLGWLDLDLPAWAALELGPRRRSFLVRTLNPAEDKMEVATLRPNDMPKAAHMLGVVAATTHARSAGMPGLATPQELADWSNDADWFQRMRDWTLVAARHMAELYATFCEEHGVAAKA